MRTETGWTSYQPTDLIEPAAFLRGRILVKPVCHRRNMIAREQALKLLATNPGFKEIGESGQGHVIVGVAPGASRAACANPETARRISCTDRTELQKYSRPCRSGWRRQP
jgi:hypothetical protein